MMKKFSERIGAAEIPCIIQLDTMSVALRNSIWNLIFSLIDNRPGGWYAVADFSAQFFFKLPVDEIPPYDNPRRDWIKKQLFNRKWYEVYDYAEFIADNYEQLIKPSNVNRKVIQSMFNSVFIEERSGYRFLAGELVPISASEEVAAIESALATTSKTGLLGAHVHISTALQLLAKKPEPDYRNSIKESISAVEALAKQLGTTSSQGLAGALTELGKKMPIHKGLRSGLLSLYGYTSDEGGIRHAMLEEPDLGYDEAKYMAVVCSAFVNFLAAKAGAAGLLPKN